jgi:pimeloyl-ACP methyl ester carboxylesterase
MVKELSSRLEEFVVPDKTQEISARLAGPGVEECWMEVDGARMRYLRAGSGPALILLHGLLGYSFSWRFTIPALAPYATVYAPDMLGAGFSDRPMGLDCGMRAAAGRLLRFVKQLGISSFDLLGTSHGGAVAILASAECQKADSSLHVRRLILVAPVNPYSAHGQRLAPFFGSHFGSALFRIAVGRMRLMQRLALIRLYGNRKRIPAGTFEGYTAQLVKPGSIEYALGIARCWTADLREVEAALPKLADIPTLLVWGRKDPAVYASSAKRLAEYFPNSRTIIFPGIGHLPYEECPEEFNRALIEFLTNQKVSA